MRFLWKYETITPWKIFGNPLYNIKTRGHKTEVNLFGHFIGNLLRNVKMLCYMCIFSATCKTVCLYSQFTVNSCVSFR